MKNQEKVERFKEESLHEIKQRMHRICEKQKERKQQNKRPRNSKYSFGPTASRTLYQSSSGEDSFDLDIERELNEYYLFKSKEELESLGTGVDLLDW